MSDDIESRMRSALRAVAPREEFSEKLLAKLTSEQAPPRKSGRAAPRLRPLAWWFSASLAASAILAVGVHQHLEQQRMQQSGIEARREVLEALRVTSQKLNLAYEAVKSQSSSLTDEGNSA